MVYKNGVIRYIVVALAFGIPMGIFSGITSFNLIIGIVGGLLAGILFSLCMLIFTKVIESANKKRKALISQNRAVICEGPANISANGGWLYFTQYGLEFYPHKLNISTNEIFIPIETIQSVAAHVNKITVYTTNINKFNIVVPHSKDWKNQIDNYIYYMRTNRNNTTQANGNNYNSQPVHGQNFGNARFGR